MKTYEIRIGNRVLEYDPKAGLTRLVERLPLEKSKQWYLDEQGQHHYPAGDFRLDVATGKESGRP